MNYPLCLGLILKNEHLIEFQGIISFISTLAVSESTPPVYQNTSFVLIQGLRTGDLRTFSFPMDFSGSRSCSMMRKNPLNLAPEDQQKQQ